MSGADALKKTPLGDEAMRQRQAISRPSCRRLELFTYACSRPTRKYLRLPPHRLSRRLLAADGLRDGIRASRWLAV